MSNYPDGVSDSHDYFNPPRELALELECGADEAPVVPFHAVRKALDELSEQVNRLSKGRMMEERPHSVQMLESIVSGIALTSDYLTTLKQEREYECPFKGEVDVEESAEAHWDCPVCGNDRTADTLPEERDPDEGWDNRWERS